MIYALGKTSEGRPVLLIGLTKDDLEKTLPAKETCIATMPPFTDSPIPLGDPITKGMELVVFHEPTTEECLGVLNKMDGVKIYPHEPGS